jgi:ADP-ribose pyrophosphatase YjhB (NUDIX family)
MARRIDFHHDPDAPAASSIVPAVNVAVTNEGGELLLIRRSDNDNWALPGGGVDIGESLTQAAVRETREESGIECQVTGLSGIYTDPRHVILYTSNGEVRQEFSILVATRPGPMTVPVTPQPARLHLCSDGRSAGRMTRSSTPATTASNREPRETLSEFAQTDAESKIGRSAGRRQHPAERQRSRVGLAGGFGVLGVRRRRGG